MPSSDSVDDVCFVSIEDIKKLVDHNDDATKTPVVIIGNTISDSNDSIVLGNETNNKACRIITNQDIEKLEQWLIEFLTIDTYNKEIDDRLINASTKGIYIHITIYLDTNTNTNIISNTSILRMSKGNILFLTLL